MNNTKLLDKVPGWMVALAATIPLLGGCAPGAGGDADGEEAVGQVQQRVGSVNDLSRNSLSYNDLSRNDLSRNDLSRNDLSRNDLSRNAMAAEGYGLQLMKYMVRCALPDNVCVDVDTTATDSDVPTECVNGVCHFCGILGLAPNWQTGPLSLADEKWISACLLAHVNLDGVSIPISVRDADAGRLPAAHPPETNNYDASEAAFYGNLFERNADGVIEKYVCNAGATDLPPGRSCGLDNYNAVECTMIYTGSCVGHVISEGTSGMAGINNGSGVAACAYLDALPNGAVKQCVGAPGSSWDEVITIYDHRICGNGICSGSETVGNCPQDCKIDHSNNP